MLVDGNRQQSSGAQKLTEVEVADNNTNEYTSLYFVVVVTFALS